MGNVRHYARGAIGSNASNASHGQQVILLRDFKEITMRT